MKRHHPVRDLATSFALVLALLFAWHTPSLAGEKKNDVIVLGMSAAFTGSNGELGIEFYRGIMAYFDHINANGGINGRKLEIKPLNDGYNPLPCFRNTLQFIQNDDVFALFSYVGTPTTTRILPLLQRYSVDNMVLLFPFTGAVPLREAPYNRYVYNLRPSYFQETKGLVDGFISSGRPRVGIFYQADAYGRNGWDGVRRALKDHGLQFAGEAAYSRGTRFEDDYTDSVKLLQKSNPDAIICIGTYSSCGGFIRDARKMRYESPIASVSFADSGKTLNLLMEAGGNQPEKYLNNLIFSQVVPNPYDENLPGIQLYRQLMDASNNLPKEVPEGYAPRQYSSVSLEGFLNARLMAEIIRRMGNDVRRERIPEIMAALADVDLGIGHNVSFGPGANQGLNQIHYITVKEGRPTSFEDWNWWKK